MCQVAYHIKLLVLAFFLIPIVARTTMSGFPIIEFIKMVPEINELS